VFQNKAFKVWT